MTPDDEEGQINDILELGDMISLRRENPNLLFRYLQQVRKEFLFGVDVPGSDDVERGWGGDARLLLNRNVSLHLVAAFSDEIQDETQLPQFTVFPEADRAGQVETTSIRVEDEEVRGVIFYVDPFDYDAMVRDAVRIAELYPDWDLIPNRSAC